MGALIGLAAGVLLAALAGLVLLSGRYRLAPKSLKLPFMEFDASRFHDLSPVKMFQSLSRMMIAPSDAAMHWLSEREAFPPVILVHLGWQVVCDAFVERFVEYPSEERVRAHVAELGSQNSEFILTFAGVYAVAVRNPDDVEPEFAREYFLRAPALAQRVSFNGKFESSKLFELASAIVAPLAVLPKSSAPES